MGLAADDLRSVREETLRTAAQRLAQRRPSAMCSLGCLSGAIWTQLTSSENPLYVVCNSIAAGSVVVNRPGNTSRCWFLSANEEPSWITISLNRATDACPSGASVWIRKRSVRRASIAA
jgi:hypothetical protein